MVELLCDCLKFNTNIEHVSLNKNPIDVLGCSYLTKMFPLGLKSLNISETSIKDQGAITILKYFKKNNCLEIIDLSNNKLTILMQIYQSLREVNLYIQY